MVKFNKTLWITIVVLFVVLFFITIAFLKPFSDKSKIRIGSVLILSGEYKSYGEYFQQGALLAAEEMNSSQKQQIELTILDSEGSKEKALEKLKALKEQKNIHFVADVMGTAMMRHVIPFINENKILVLSGVNTGPELSGEGGSFFFRIIPSDGIASQQLSKWAIESGFKKGAILYATDDWGQGLRKALDKSYRDLGGEIIDSRDVEVNQTIFQPIVSLYKETKPNVVFLVLYPKTAALFLREVKKQGLQTQIMGTDNFTASELPDIARDAVDGVNFIIPQPAGEPTPQQKNFLELYNLKYGIGKKPHIFTTMAYDCVKLLAKIYQETQGDPERAAKTLEMIQYEGASGHIAFDKNHDVVVKDFSRKVYKYDKVSKKASILDAK